MQHREFAEKASRKLEALAESTREVEGRIGQSITSMRANELMVAARVVRDLSELATRQEAAGPAREREATMVPGG